MSTAEERMLARNEGARRHHQGRVVWLSGPDPKFCDGSPVPKALARELLEASRRELRRIEETGMCLYSPDDD